MKGMEKEEKMRSSKRGQNKITTDISKPFWFCKQWQTGAIRKRKLQENRNLDKRRKQQHTSLKPKKKVKGNRKEGWTKIEGIKKESNTKVKDFQTSIKTDRNTKTKYKPVKRRTK